MKYLTILTGLILILGCTDTKNSTKKEKRLQPTTYRASLETMDDKELPFIFKVLDAHKIEVYNADEVINVTDIAYKNDSVYVYMPAFEGYLVAKINDDNLNGSFIKESLDRVVPFTAQAGDRERFRATKKPIVDLSGSWETVFSKDNEGEEYIAKGIFEQEGGLVTGTIRTTTGDYRYLEGVLDGDQLKLSAFDGAHAFLLTATVTDSTYTGTFYSGNHFKEPFEGFRNEAFELQSATTLTQLNDGFETLEFSYPGLDGKKISLKDERFKNKVVLVQVMGSWCPNCLDESKYYANYYNINKERDIEIIALAFEYAKTEERAMKSLSRFKENAGITYPMALAQFGTSSKSEAQKKLPMLNHVLSYPTTIFIDRKGKVRKIHTGFNGPATGQKYVEFKEEFTSFIDELLAETS